MPEIVPGIISGVKNKSRIFPSLCVLLKMAGLVRDELSFHQEHKPVYCRTYVARVFRTDGLHSQRLRRPVIFSVPWLPSATASSPTLMSGFAPAFNHDEVHGDSSRYPVAPPPYEHTSPIA